MWQWPAAYVRCSPLPHTPPRLTILPPLTLTLVTPRTGTASSLGHSCTFLDVAARAAPFLKSVAPMMKRTQPTSHRIVRWIFQRGNELLTCRVDQESDRSSYTLSLVPNSNVDAAVVEMFESGIVALQRHAGMAAQLRELGWTLIAYTGSRSADRRSYQPAVA